MGLFFKDSETAERILTKLSVLIIALISIVSIVSLSLLFYVEVGAGVNPIEIYVRVLSTVVCLLILGAFFARYYCYLRFMNNSSRRLKIVSFILAAAGFIKVAISIYYFSLCLLHHNMVAAFYVGEILVWTAVAIFAIMYIKRLD